jgi:hypothetical protein
VEKCKVNLTESKLTHFNAIKVYRFSLELILGVGCLEIAAEGGPGQARAENSDSVVRVRPGGSGLALDLLLSLTCSQWYSVGSDKEDRDLPSQPNLGPCGHLEIVSLRRQKKLVRRSALPPGVEAAVWPTTYCAPTDCAQKIDRQKMATCGCN